MAFSLNEKRHRFLIHACFIQDPGDVVSEHPLFFIKFWNCSVLFKFRNPDISGIDYRYFVYDVQLYFLLEVF